MTPGWKTSEGRLAFLHAAVTATIAVLTLTGTAVPTWLRPDAPWIGTAALLAGFLSTALYSHGRVTLKKLAVITPPVTVITPPTA